MRPRLVPWARLRPDGDHVLLLMPERGLRLNASAAEIVARCDGSATRDEIVAELSVVHGGADVGEDVDRLLAILARHALLERP